MLTPAHFLGFSSMESRVSHFDASTGPFQYGGNHFPFSLSKDAMLDHSNKTTPGKFFISELKTLMIR